MRTLLTLICALGLAATPAVAGQAVTLKADTVDADGMITLSDIFDNAGTAGRVPVAARVSQSMVLDALAVQAMARRNGLDWANVEGLRRIVVRAESSGAATPHGNIDVLTYARSLSTGDLVQPSDLVWGKVAAAPSQAPSDAEQMIGLVAKRPLRAGSIASLRDVAAQQVIKVGDLITVTYEAEGVSLALQGKAMAAAAQGESVVVLNTTSKKIIQAVAIGPGQAAIGPGADLARATPRAQIALR